MSEDSIARKFTKKVQKHKKKAGALSIATVITALQMVGVMGPMLCSLPFITDTKACLDTTKRAGQAAKDLHHLDAMVLDDGTPLDLETVEGGQP